MDLQVQKKSGAMQPFDRNKIISGLMRSGASQEEAENIAVQIESWAQGAAVNGVVQAMDIRTKVLELLEAVNPSAAEAFRSYQKPVQA